MTALILYGIIGGLFTPTEASIVAVLYAVLVGTFVYRKLTPKRTLVVVLDSMRTSAALMVLIGFANLFGYLFITERLPQVVSAQILGFSDNPYVVLLLINILLIVVGTFMETIAALLILFPILLKVAVTVGIDPIHFSVIALLNLMIGLTTPPLGVCLRGRGHRQGPHRGRGAGGVAVFAGEPGGAGAGDLGAGAHFVAAAVGGVGFRQNGRLSPKQVAVSRLTGRCARAANSP